MKVTLLNGSLEKVHADFDSKLERYKQRLIQSPDITQLDNYNLKDMDIKQCIGCFQCWIKTPGKCVIKDDAEKILVSYIRSDLVIFASPLVMGMTTGLMKRLNDRLIPLIHPYFSIVEGEIHHLERYDKYPQIACLYAPSPEDTQEDIALCEQIYERLAINVKSNLRFFKSIQEVEEGEVL